MNTTQPPPLWERAWNLAQAVAAYVGDGCQQVSKAEYEHRLTICHACPERSDTVCLKCGCIMPLKAKMRVMECPLGRWPRSGEMNPEGGSATTGKDDASAPGN
jgi:hypothetical protein